MELDVEGEKYLFMILHKLVAVSSVEHLCVSVLPTVFTSHSFIFQLYFDQSFCAATRNFS